MSVVTSCLSRTTGEKQLVKYRNPNHEVLVLKLISKDTPDLSNTLIHINLIYFPKQNFNPLHLLGIAIIRVKNKRIIYFKTLLVFHF